MNAIATRSIVTAVLFTLAVNGAQAAEAVRDFTCSVCLGPISLSPTDHRSIETFAFAVAEGDSWVIFGDVVSYESTP